MRNNARPSHFQETAKKKGISRFLPKDENWAGRLYEYKLNFTKGRRQQVALEGAHAELSNVHFAKGLNLLCEVIDILKSMA